MPVNTQFKKGVLELIVLLSVYKKDMYGYELVSEVSKVIDVNEGTIYPLLKRLTNEHYFETYFVESREGPSRNYYTITSLGKVSGRLSTSICRYYQSCSLSTLRSR